MPILTRSPNDDPIRRPAFRADLLDVLQQAASGLFPGAALEALIARMEAGK